MNPDGSENYEIVVTSYNKNANPDGTLRIIDRIIDRFGALRIKYLETLDDLDFVANILLFPIQELQRFFINDDDMYDKLIPLFIEYCKGIQETIQPMLRENPRGSRTYMNGSQSITYEDVHRGLGEYIELLSADSRESIIYRLKKTTNHKRWLRHALVYIRNNRENFLHFILDHTGMSDSISDNNNAR